jgi:hypothetical protein
MKRALDIMKIIPEFEKHGKDFMRIISIQQSVISSVLSTTARVESAKLRSKTDDGMDKVLHALKDAERKAMLN